MKISIAFVSKKTDFKSVVITSAEDAEVFGLDRTFYEECPNKCEADQATYSGDKIEVDECMGCGAAFLLDAEGERY